MTGGGHLRGPVTFTPYAERLAVDLYDLGLSRAFVDMASNKR